MGVKYKYSEVNNFLESMGVEWLDDEYTGSRMKVHLRCPKHGEFEKKYSSIKTYGFACRECNKKEKTNHTIDTTREFAPKLGLELITTEYIKWNLPMIVKCPKHGEFETSAYRLKAGNGCSKCATEKMRIPIERIRKRAEELGYSLVSTEYKRCDAPLICKCPKHGNFKTNWSALKRGSHCLKCDNEMRRTWRGERNSQWAGKNNDLINTLRAVLNPWRDNLYKEAGGICQITGLKGKLNVHHMTSFTKIVDDVFYELGLDVRETSSDYTDGEWATIVDLLIKKNSELASPIVMLESVHKAFHMFCGGYHKPTTEEQLKTFIEFKEFFLQAS